MNTRLFAAVLMLALTACGGGHKSTSNAAAASAPASPVAVATVPASLHCGAVSPVWANTRTKVYHVSSDPLYGRTKHGEYLCPSQAAREGYHEAGSKSGSMRPRHHKRSGSMMQAQPSPSPGT